MRLAERKRKPTVCAQCRFAEEIAGRYCHACHAVHPGDCTRRRGSPRPCARRRFTDTLPTPHTVHLWTAPARPTGHRQVHRSRRGRNRMLMCVVSAGTWTRSKRHTLTGARTRGELCGRCSRLPRVRRRNTRAGPRQSAHGKWSGWGRGRTRHGDATHEAGEVRRKEMAGRGWGMVSSSPHPPAFKCAPDADGLRPLPCHVRPMRCALRLFGSCRARYPHSLRHALPSDDGAPAYPHTPSPDGRPLRKTPCAPRRVSGRRRRRGRGREARLVDAPSAAQLEDVSVPQPTMGFTSPHTLRTRRLESHVSDPSP